ncbi:DUF502 domain-containing protein [Variovorax sp.]|uniref:DUF502 domain-containing protein n=1 Tax=Variovorax sp. TaxID=1871043 RepID=UPI002D5BF192|nr:DUF502 domain-containing protein [Variovorax sp.]HYP85168.1 DUF502 domain-containing protein [Variovorax sp.]
MKAIWNFLINTLIGGLLVLLPAYLAILLIVKGMMGLVEVAKPLVKVLPIDTDHHAIAALLLIILASFIVGLAVRTWPGRPLGRWLDKGLLDRIPGYTFLRSLLGRTFGDETAEFRVAFIEFDDNTAIGFVVEQHEDGNYTVFMPSSPTPFSGTVLLMPAQRVHFVDVPFMQAFSSMAKWGTGVRSLAQVLDQQRAPRA